MSRHPVYQNSTIVQTSAMASRLIVTGSNKIANALLSRADTFTQTTKPQPKPITFSPAAYDRIRKINHLSSSAVGLSSKTVGHIERIAQNIGTTLAHRKTSESSSRLGEPPAEFKPGVMNKSLIAFNTLMDGLEQSARTLLSSGGDAVHTVVQHRYGPEMGEIAKNVTRGFRNVGVVYVDATGVSRKAILKSVAKGMVIGRMYDGQQVVVGGGDGGLVPTPPVDASTGKVDYGYYGGKGSNPNQRSFPPSSSSIPSRDHPVLCRPSPSPTPPPPYSTSRTYSSGGFQTPPPKR
jgi:spartin